MAQKMMHILSFIGGYGLPSIFLISLFSLQMYKEMPPSHCQYFNLLHITSDVWGPFQSPFSQNCIPTLTWTSVLIFLIKFYFTRVSNNLSLFLAFQNITIIFSFSMSQTYHLFLQSISSLPILFTKILILLLPEMVSVYLLLRYHPVFLN